MDHTPGYNVHQAGPYTYWPTNDGFDHTYVFMAADANNFTPVMYAGHEPIEPALGNPDYHLSEDMADKAIHYLTGHVSINPEKPFFMFWAPGAMHAPHHAPKEYIEKYKGKFDMGWDRAREVIFEKQKLMGLIPKDTVLTTRVEEIEAWDTKYPQNSGNSMHGKWRRSQASWTMSMLRSAAWSRPLSVSGNSTIP